MSVHQIYPTYELGLSFQWPLDVSASNPSNLRAWF